MDGAIQGITETIKNFTSTEKDFRGGLKAELEKLGELTKGLIGIADKLKSVKAEVGTIRTQLKSANKAKEDADKQNKTINEAIGELNKVVEQLNSIEPASASISDMLASSMKAITDIQTQVASMEGVNPNAQEFVPTGGPPGQVQRAVDALEETSGADPGSNLQGGRRRRRRRGGYSYRKKSKSPRKTRKAKKTKSKSKTRSKTRSKSRSRTRSRTR